MIGRIFTVGGLTLLSRLTGFARDIVLAALLGAGPIADAFFVALRLPNHFRAIFAEGAFNAAFVPAYARIRQQGGADPAKLFADRVFTLLFASEVVLLAIALVFTPAVISALAPGFSDDPERFALAVELTRITFPYLLLVSLVTLYSGILNALSRFAAAAAAPVLLNLSMMATLAVAVFFPTPGHAAAWGVLIAGFLEVLLVGGDAWRQGVMTVFRWPGQGIMTVFHWSRWDEDVRRFFKALWPATIGSAGVQIALFADTFIASFLAAGALSALYYADRLNQLPIGVIGIAIGTVLLPEMASRIAAGDETGARRAQDRAIELTLLLSIPCLVAFLLIPDLIMRALFMRGKFSAADAAAAGQTLAAYALGLLPFVLIRSVTATFLARGDTATPVKASLTAMAVNVAFKVMLMGSLAQVGLALATSIGAWLNLGLVVWFALRQGHLAFASGLRMATAKFAVAGVALTLALWLAQGPVTRLFADWPSWREESTLALLVLIGGVVYFAIILALFGPQWLAALRARKRPPTQLPSPPLSD
jgi:putative peptidoglycan lipid II flippase